MSISLLTVLPLFNYKLSTCTGESQATGRVLNNLIIESDDGSTQLKLPAILECDQIPVNIDEIPTKEVAESYWYMKDIVDFIPPLNEQLGIVLLIGRDLIEAHHLLDDRNCSKNTFSERKQTYFI